MTRSHANAPEPRRLQALFDAASEQPPAERGPFLAQACAGDGELQRHVEELLAAGDAAPDFLDRPAADVELEGRVAGPWRIEALLATGGMGDVHRAVRVDETLPWRVALKVLKRGLDGAAFVRRFEAERRSLAALAHPHIVALIDAGQLDDGRPFLAMELVDGAPIDRWCREQSLPLAARVRLFLDVCDAVDHAHRRLVLHCDLKPGNVLVNEAGVVKLLDFGVARLLEPHGDGERCDGEQCDGERRGGPSAAPLRSWTAGYASPELMEGGSVDVTSDVFSLGVLLRELVMGESALRGDFGAIVAKSLAQRPEARYATVEAFARDLRAWLDHRPVAARGGGALDRARKLVRRNRVASAAIVVAVASLAWGAFTTWRQLQESRVDAQLGWRAHAEALDVSRFLQRLVVDAGSDDPRRLAAALDRAVATLAAAGEIAPEVEGRTRMAIGALYLEVGRADQARPQLERAHALATTQRGFGRKDVAWIEQLLARAAPDGEAASPPR